MGTNWLIITTKNFSRIGSQSDPVSMHRLLYLKGLLHPALSLSRPWACGAMAFEKWKGPVFHPT